MALVIAGNADAFAEAGALVANADVLLICSGAGLSADSGLPTCADIENVEAYRERGLERFQDICNPQWLAKDAEFFWGYWGQCFNDYRDTAPHEGYKLLEAWAEQRFRYSDCGELLRTRLREQHEELAKTTTTFEEALAQAAGDNDLGELDGDWFLDSPELGQFDYHFDQEGQSIRGTGRTHGAEKWVQQVDGRVLKNEFRWAVCVDNKERCTFTATVEDDFNSFSGSGFLYTGMRITFKAHRSLGAMEDTTMDFAGGFYALTSNVDAHHFDSFHAAEVYECHGNVETYTCTKSDCTGFSRAPLDFRFDVDSTTRLAAAAAVPSAADDSSMRPQLLRYMPPILSACIAGNHPTCPKCGAAARPAAFGGRLVRDNQNAMASDRFQKWLDAVSTLAAERVGGKSEPELRVVILELGAGSSTVRNTSEQALVRLHRAGAHIQLVRVNPKDALPDATELHPGQPFEKFLLKIPARSLETLRKMSESMPEQLRMALTV